MGTKQPYGWDEAGNCLWCGEAGRCQCDHSRQVEAAAMKLRTHGDLLAACKAIVDARDSAALADDPAYHWIDLAIDAARAVVAKAEGGDA